MLSGWILLTEFLVVLEWRPICSLDDVCSLFLACTPALLGWLCIAGVVFFFVLELLDVCTPVVFELLHLFQWIVETLLGCPMFVMLLSHVHDAVVPMGCWNCCCLVNWTLLGTSCWSCALLFIFSLMLSHVPVSCCTSLGLDDVSWIDVSPCWFLCYLEPFG